MTCKVLDRRKAIKGQPYMPGIAKSGNEARIAIYSRAIVISS